MHPSISHLYTSLSSLEMPFGLSAESMKKWLSVSFSDTTPTFTIASVAVPLSTSTSSASSEIFETVVPSSVDFVETVVENVPMETLLATLPKVKEQAAQAAGVVHPFFPKEIELTGFVENTHDAVALLAGFAIAALLLMGGAVLLLRWWRPGMRRGEVVAATWFAFTGSLHVFFEGYFVYNHAHMPERMDFVGQMWKEYARSDSRYLTRNTFVLCTETITSAILGPLCLLTAVLIAQDSKYRYPLQALVSTGQVYSDLLYYATSLYELFVNGVDYSRPEHIYFWVYFIAMNAIWLVIPGYCIYCSFVETARAFATVRRLQKTMSSDGETVKKLLDERRRNLESVPDETVMDLTAADITAALPPDGLTIGELMRAFRGRIKNTTQGKKHFIGLLKANSVYDSATKKVMPKSF